VAPVVATACPLAAETAPVSVALSAVAVGAGAGTTALVTATRDATVGVATGAEPPEFCDTDGITRETITVSSAAPTVAEIANIKKHAKSFFILAKLYHNPALKIIRNLRFAIICSFS
jgi:hypothetical protein